MQILGPLLLLAGMSVSSVDFPSPKSPEPSRLREMLLDRQHPRSQSQAALLLLQNADPEAEEIIREGLKQTDTTETFLVLTEALRLAPDCRFVPELLLALANERPVVRQAAVETLAALADGKVLVKLQNVVEDTAIDLAVRQAAIMALGRSGRKPAAVVLLDQLSGENDALRRAAADALADLTGQAYGNDVALWRGWWERHKEMTAEHWLEERLAFQTSRARRLDGDLERAKSQILRLHQQLYARLPAADRLGHVQSLVELDDATLRNQAVTWSLELLPGADAVGQKNLADALLRLSRDGSVDVQRNAVLALGRVNDTRVFERLKSLLKRGAIPVRAAAARALALQAHGTGPEVIARQKQVVPVLQKALEESALEVVVEAAEALGTLGVPEAGPVLAVLLRHPAESVRQTAAQALERVADACILDGLLAALDDTAASVRFSLVGALSRASVDPKALTTAQRERLLSRLEELLRRDTDPGVRSRAATALGDIGTPTVLPLLWARVQDGEESRVQEKAWAAFGEVLVRSESLELLNKWTQTLADAKQGPRRLQLLTDLLSRWQKKEETKSSCGAVSELLVQTQLDESKWALAFPLVQEMLAKPGTDGEWTKRLRWLLTIGEAALKEGNRAEAQRVVQEAQPHLQRNAGLALEFEKLAKEAQADK